MAATASRAERAPLAQSAEAARPFAAAGLERDQARPLDDIQLAEVERLVAGVKAQFASERDSLEMLPASSLRILNLVARPQLELSDVTSAVSQDPAISAAVLRVANSAMTSAAAPEVRTVRDAIAQLGVTEVAHVAAAVAARVLFAARAKAEQAMFAARRSELHWGAVTAAAGAAQLSMQRRRGRSDLAYLGGMLHDVGKSVALGSLSALAVAGRASREIAPLVLNAVLEQVHTEIGTEALRHWSMPGQLVTLCATHHDPKLPDSAECTETHLVRVVSGLLALRADPSDHEAGELLLQSASVLQIEPAQLRALDADLRTLAQRMGRVLGLGAGAKSARGATKADA